MITPLRFWDKFAERLKKDISELNDRSDWLAKCKSSTEWTAFMTKSLIQLGKDLGFDKKRGIGTEFYRIDLGYFVVHDPVKDIEGKFYDYNWDLEVAIEHENNSSTWYYEFVKLVHINCGLKVLITYHKHNNKDTEFKNKFDILLDLYRPRQYTQRNDRWLLIFGPTSNNLDKDFVAYKFDGKNFLPLPKRKIIPASQ